MAQVEAVLLTGGASRRMGTDKASLVIGGQKLAEKIAKLLAGGGCKVTVLGREPVAGFEFQIDKQEFAGPLTALAEFRPTLPYVFVCSCDLPHFDPRIIELLLKEIDGKHVAVPLSEGKLQPLCALYRKEAFANIKSLLQSGKKSMMAWLESLDMVEIPEKRFSKSGLDARCVRGFNSPEELSRLQR